MPTPLTRTELDAMQCGNPEHDHSQPGSHVLTISGHCHPGASTFAEYDQGNGTLTITCAFCDGYVSTIQVAGEALETR